MRIGNPTGFICACILQFSLLFPHSACGQNKALDEARQLEQTARDLFAASRHPESIPYATQVVEIHERILGKDHPQLAKSLNFLAQLYKITGRYSEAEPLHL